MGDINKENKSMMEDFFETTKEDLDNFEKFSWAKKTGYKLPSYPIIDEKLEGLEEGLYLFASESNMGKTALMTNMLYDLCMCEENKLFGIYYSLDDSKFEVIPRVIAMDQRIPIGVCAKPFRYQSKIDAGEENASLYQEQLTKRTLGINKLKEACARFKIEDSTKIKTAEDIYEHIQQLIIYLKAIDRENNLIVAIDSLNDIKFRDKRFSSEVEKHGEIARMVKDWATEFKIPIFGSSHLRKINQNVRPTLDHLKESGEYVYEASVVWLLHNDVSKNKQAAKIYYSREDIQGKCPIIEMDWAKNKKSSFKGRTFNFFAPDYSRAVECDAESSQRYNNLIYEC